MVVIARQRGDVHQAFDVDVGQFDEQTKTSHRGDHARERLAHAILHELALEPVHHVAGRFVGTALAHRALLAELLQGRFVVRIDARFRNGHRTGTANVRGVLLRMDHAADRPVREQVRVAADRRSEVGVRLVIQAEVALVVGAVHRLAQRTQHDGLDQMEIRAILDTGQQCLVILRRRTVLAFVQGQAELAEERAQLFQTLRWRAIVNAVQRRDFVLFQEFGGGHVGRQHAFLDQLVGIVAYGWTDFGDLALGTEDDPGFLRFEIDRATHVTGGQQYLVQRIKLLEVRHDVGVFATQFARFGSLRRFQHRADLVVGQAGVGVNHRFVEAVVGHFAGFGDGHLANHGQTIDLRVQRAQTVGQLLRQHRDHALGEVHRVAANLRFGIQRRTEFHVAGYVGNRHVQLPATGEQAQLARTGLAVDRVIEVAGIFTVDGDERQMTQVDALLFVFLFDFRLELAGFLEHGVRPDVRNVVGAQGDIDFHARRHVVTHDFNHVALRLEAWRRPVGDLHFDELTDLRIGITARRHQHFLLDLRVVGNDETDTALFEVTTDDGFVSTGHHFDDHAFAATATVQTGNAGQGTVTVEHQTHLRRAHEQVVTAVVRHQEAEAVTVTADAAQDQVELVHRRISAATGIDELSIALHGAQAAAQGFDLVFCGQTKLFDQLLAVSRRTSISKMLKDQFAARNGVFVFFRFTSGLGIEGLPIGH
ncbi:hypothetical protein D3C81_831830 [compost metagenome]